MSSSPVNLVCYGWSERVADLVAAARSSRPGTVPGRVVRDHKDRVRVVTEDGEVFARASDLPATGDWVLLHPPEAEGGDHVVATVLPRWSALVRRTGDGHEQVMAADLDLVFVVTGADRGPNWNRVERELVLAWESGARPVVVVNKTDCRTDVDRLGAEAEARLGETEVRLCSALTGAGVDGLRDLARSGRTVAFLGASGVGKSSLVNALVGREAQEVGAVRSGDQKGRHTTVARHLLPLPGGGVLLDTPGVRSLGLPTEVTDGLAATFVEIEELADECRFRDCAHESEPGCAVRAAVGAGDVSADRFASYQKLRQEQSAGRQGRRW